MPRNGDGVYTLPSGSEAITGETAIAPTHNLPVNDLEADANFARPIVAGGTGASTARESIANLGGASFDNTRTTMSDTVVVETDNNAVILVNAVGGDVTVTLPQASVIGDKFRVIVKRIDATGNTVTVQRSGSDTIDGAESNTNFIQYQVREYLSDSNNWYIIGQYGQQLPEIFTITSSDIAWSPPRNGVTDIIVIGGGGAGTEGVNTSSGGGGAGGTCIANNVSLLTSQTYNVTIGSNGNGNVGVGTAGGTSSFVGHEQNLIANGGFGSSGASGGSGGTASGGDLNLVGGSGGTGSNGNAGGGGSIGGFQDGVIGSNNNGFDGGNAGSGAGGGGAGTGGDGANGGSLGGGGGGSHGPGAGTAGGPDEFGTSTASGSYVVVSPPSNILDVNGGGGAGRTTSGAGYNGGAGGGGGGTIEGRAGNGGFGAGGGGTSSASESDEGGSGGVGGGGGGGNGASGVTLNRGGDGMVIVRYI